MVSSNSVVWIHGFITCPYESHYCPFGQGYFLVVLLLANHFLDN